MSTALPALNSFPRPSRRVTVSNYPHQPAEEVVIQAAEVDAGNSAFRTSFLRPGYVLVRRASSGEYVNGGSANADRQVAASVVSLITNPGAGAWDGNLVIVGHWGTLTVALSGDNTDAAVAAAVIAKAAAENPESKAPITATSGGGTFTISNTEKGDGTWIQAYHATVIGIMAAGAGATAGVQGSAGTDPEIVVTLEYVDMLNGSGVGVAASSKSVLRVGHFDAANLINLTAEAYAVLRKRGCRFYGTPTLVG